MLHTAVSDLIGRIYQSAQDGSALEGAVERMRLMTGADTVMMTLANPAEGRHEQLRWYGDMRSSRLDAFEDYEAGLFAFDPSFDHVRANPNGRFFDMATHIRDSRPVKDDFLLWMRSNAGMAHWLLGYTIESNRSSFGLTIHRNVGSEPLTPEQRALFVMLFEHFDRAVRLSARLSLLSREREAAIVVGPAEDILATTPGADKLLERGDGLRRDGNRLSPCFRSQRARLDALLASAIRAVQEGSVGGAMSIDRRSGGPPLSVLVDPLPAEAGLGAFAQGAVVTVVEPDRGPPATACAHWRQLWTLTPAEARVAEALLAESCNLARAAERIGISYETARTHLARVFQKTGTNGQPELVRLLTRVSG